MRSSKTLLTDIGNYCKLCSSSNGVSVVECPMCNCPLWEHLEGANTANLAVIPRYSDPNSRHKREISYILAEEIKKMGLGVGGQRTFQKTTYIIKQADRGDKYAMELANELKNEKISIHRAYTLHREYVKNREVTP